VWEKGGKDLKGERKRKREKARPTSPEAPREGKRGREYKGGRKKEKHASNQRPPLVLGEKRTGKGGTASPWPKKKKRGMRGKEGKKKKERKGKLLMNRLFPQPNE